MGSINEYRKIIREVLTEYADLPRGNFQSETIVDEKTDRYLLMVQGWQNVKRIHQCVAHIEIIDGKIWIQHDGTEPGVATELVEAGVSRDQIVLAWQHPFNRQLGEFAAA